MKCIHEIVLETKNKTKFEIEGNLEEMLVCARCSVAIKKDGKYERIKNAMAEIYHENGFFKRYKVYKLVEDYE